MGYMEICWENWIGYNPCIGKLHQHDVDQALHR